MFPKSETHYNQSFRLKTQKAIETINKFDYNSKDFLSTARLQTSKKIIMLSKLANSHQWMRAQLLPHSIETYELVKPTDLLKRHADNEDLYLKILVKNFTGTGCHLYTDNQAGEQLGSQNSHFINGEKLLKIKINFREISKVDKFYISVKSSKQLAIFRFKYEFASNIEQNYKSSLQKSIEKQKVKQRKTEYSLNQLGTPRIRIKTNNDDSPLKKLQKRYDSEKKIPNVKLIRTKSKQMEKQKQAKCKLRFQQQEIYKSKNRQYTDKAMKCKQLIKDFEIFSSQDRIKSSEMVRNLTKMIYAFQFTSILTEHAINKKTFNAKTARREVLVKQFSKIMKEKHTRTLEIQPYCSTRQGLNLLTFTVLTGKLVHKKCKNRATKIILNCFNNTQVPNQINIIFEKTTEFRRKIRLIQRSWKSKFHSTQEMLRIYIKNCQNQMAIKFPHFKLVQKLFLQRNMYSNLAYQYQKDTSMKLKDVYSSYQAKLKQIQQIKQANEDIKQFNATCLKKYIKKFLDVPALPTYPVTRYFRDLSVLKSMVRTWFEVEYRRWVKKNKKPENNSPPKAKKK